MRLRRGRPWTWPLLAWWKSADWLAWLWWSYTEALRPDKFPPYRAAERAFTRLYWGVYGRLVVIIQREIGE